MTCILKIYSFLKLFSQRSNELYRSQIDQGHREIAKKNRELINKIHDVDSLRNRYEEAYAAAEPVGTISSKVRYTIKFYLTTYRF